MEIIRYAIIIATALLVFACGFYVGVERSFSKAHIIGTLKIAHDENDEKYMAIVLDPTYRYILDDNKNNVQMVYIEHVYNEVKND